MSGRSVLIIDYSEISLPGDVEGSLTNATYGNGVLILAMPKCDQGVSPSKAHFQLHPIASTRGEQISLYRERHSCQFQSGTQSKTSVRKITDITFFIPIQACFCIVPDTDHRVSRSSLHIIWRFSKLVRRLARPFVRNRYVNS
jgi:hypothetical protein